VTPKTESSRSASGGRPTVYDTEIERAPSAVGDLSGRSSAPTRSTSSDPRFSPNSAGDKPLTPAGRNTDSSRKTTPDAKPVSGQSYTVQPGDRLSTIAREKYGDASYVKLIKEANPGLKENMIYAGSTIVLPERADNGSSGKPELTAKRDRDAKPDPSANPAPPGRSTGAGVKPDGANPTGTAKPNGDAAKPETGTKDQTGTAGSSYTVRRGDTLRKIAKAKLNDENRWREILTLNKEKLGSGDSLEIGMTLRLPGTEKAADAKPRSRSR
jgi:nucleoid-associated protein YgaU